MSSIGGESRRSMPSGKLSTALVTALIVLSNLRHFDHVATLWVGEMQWPGSFSRGTSTAVHLGGSEIEVRLLRDLRSEVVNGSTNPCNR